MKEKSSSGASGPSLSSRERLNCLFKPSSIALIGASHSEEKLGGTVLKNLLRFPGKVYPVNPAYKEMMGLRSYGDFSEIPSGVVDLTVILRPAAEVPAILTEIGGRCRVAIIASSGFAEAGNSGLQDEVKRIGKETGVRLLGPNCMGIYNPRRRLDTLFFTPDRVRRPKRGNVALISQSGAILTSILDLLSDENIGVSVALNYGNAVDINECDIFGYIAGDKKTEVVVSYIESLEDGRRFIDEARALSAKKPLIVLKAGKTEGGRRAAYSHTGRLAGSYEIFSAALRQFGIREAGSLDELFDSVRALSLEKQGTGSRVLIVTNGGGSGALAADECIRQGLDVPPPSDDIAARLKAEFPYFFGIGNPVDLTAQVKDADYVKVLEAMGADYDGFVVIALAGVMGITQELSGMLEYFRRQTGKPLVAHVAQGRVAKALGKRLEKSGIPVYSTPEGAARGLKALLNKSGKGAS